MSQMTAAWQVVIGLEVHAQVLSQAKLFSGAPTEYGASPNDNVAFVDVAFPGMLPVLNRECLYQAIRTGLALEGTIAEVSYFDRKNYFYPDLPQGYQISQFYQPIVEGGQLAIDLDSGTKNIRIERIHLEQDAGKSIHDLSPSKTCVDYNRTGVALMEIVSYPDLRSAEEAGAYVKALRLLLRAIGTCDGNMEQGSLRADVNISVHREGEPFGTRVEVKNVNSIRNIMTAIEYERKRQVDILEAGGEVEQETKLFDPGTGKTRSLRKKENAQDYRYFPDPDLLAVVVSQEEIAQLRSHLKELPRAKKTRFEKDYGLSEYTASVLVDEGFAAEYFEDLVRAGVKSALASNWLTGDLFGLLNKEGLTLETGPISSSRFAGLLKLIQEGVISGKAAKDVLDALWSSDKSADQLVKEMGLEQISDTDALLSIINQVIESAPENVAKYQGGNDKLFGWFVGQTMKASKGKANPGEVNRLLKVALEP